MSVMTAARDFPQFGRSLSNIVRRREAAFGSERLPQESACKNGNKAGCSCRGSRGCNGNCSCGGKAGGSAECKNGKCGCESSGLTGSGCECGQAARYRGAHHGENPWANDSVVAHGARVAIASQGVWTRLGGISGSSETTTATHSIGGTRTDAAEGDRECPCDSHYWACVMDISDIPTGGSEEFCARVRRQAALSCQRYALCLTEIDHPELCPRAPVVPGCKSCLQQLDDCLRSGAPPAGCGAAYVKCMECNDKPKKSNSDACDYPDSYYYSGVQASCMCKCAGDSPWSQEVRGCLRCLYDKGVDPGLAHKACYDEASNSGYSMPTATIAACALTCPHRISISDDITDWHPWGW